MHLPSVTCSDTMITTAASAAQDTQTGDSTNSDEESDLDATIVETTQHVKGPDSVTGVAHVGETEVYMDQDTAELKYCVVSCIKGGRRGDWKMVCCILFTHWHHQQCCDSPEELKYKSASWWGPMCRRVPADIDILKKQNTFQLC